MAWNRLRNDKLPVVLCAIGLIALFTAGIFGYFTLLRQIIQEDAQFVLNEITTQRKNSAKQGIAEDYEHLYHMSNAIVQMSDDLSAAPINAYLTQAAKTSPSIKAYQVIDAQGVLQLSTGEIDYPVDSDQFLDAMLGNYTISQPKPIVADEGAVLLYLSVPILRNQVPVGVLTSICTVSDYTPLISTPVFGGFGLSCIIRDNGVAVSMPDEHAAQLPPFSFVQGFTENDALGQIDALSSLPAQLAQGQQGSLHYPFEGRDYYLSFTPMQVNDWYLISTVPADVIFHEMSTIGIIMGCVFFFTLLLAALVMGIVYYARARRRHEFAQLAYHDRITGLPRFERIDAAYARLSRTSGGSYACVLLNLNRRLLLRRTFSHSSADDLLRRIGARLTRFAADKGFVCALSEERFLLLLPCHIPSTLLSELRILIDQLEMIRVTESGVDYQFNCTFTCGVYLIAEEHVSFPSILQLLTLGFPSTDLNAEHSTCTLVNEPEKQRLLLNIQLADQVDAAFQNQEFLPYFQPQYDLNTKRVVGAEVFARWKHQEHGLLLPGSFIPSLESSGRVLDLDLYMLEAACKEIRRWTQEELLPVPLTVNISPLNIYKPDFVEKILSVIQENEIPPVLIVLEMSAAAVSENNGVQLQQVMQRLQGAGLLLSMDDFGSGSSSLTLLPELSMDVLKLSKAFYHDGNLSDKERTVLNSVVTMTRSLGVQLMAQNVELPAQADLLRAAGCCSAQGYLYSKPLSRDEFEAVIF